MKEIYFFTDKKRTNFYSGYLNGLKKVNKYSRFLGIFKRKPLDFYFKVETSEWANYERRLVYITAWAINEFVKVKYKGKNKTLDKFLDRTFPSKDHDYDCKYGKKDMIVIRSKNKKLLAKLESYFKDRSNWRAYSVLINL